MKKRTGKRVLAALLTVIMLLGNLSNFAYASAVEWPQAAEAEKPSVEIEGKVVKDPFGNLTGFFELALRVQTPAGESFRDLMVALQYDASVLQPVDWAAAPDEVTGVVNTIDLTGKGAYTVQQPAKKIDGITTSVALTGAAAAPNPDPNKNLLYFHAESQKGVSLPTMTTLAVVRFYVNPDKGAFTLAADGKTLNYNGLATSSSDFITFASDVDGSRSPAGQALVYASGNNMFYYTTSTTTVLAEVPGTAHKISAPDTVGTKVLAIDPAKPDTDPDHYSYTSNQLDGTKVKSELVLGESFSKDGVDIKKLCTITYQDWDGTVIGTQVVPQRADARLLVDEFVRENFIHTDLQADQENSVNTNYSSLNRTDTYRGAYPHSGPTGGDSEKRADGADYPLTNKLDYVFFKRVLEKDTTTNPSVPTWKVANAPYDTAYPYIHGWALVASSGDTWTTLGVGELENYNAATGSLPITPANAYFKPASFVDIKTSAMTVKAIYEPGAKLKAGYQYSIVGTPTIERYGYTASTENGTYAVKYQYERIYTDGYGVSRLREPAVKQGFTLDALAVDGNNGKSKPVYMEVKVENKDMIDVLLTPAGAVWQINYALVDSYGTNFVLATVRSAIGNSMNIPDNFNYNNFKYSTRQGSDGLVLQATINTLLTEAYKEIKDGKSDYEQHFQLSTVEDLNFKWDITGTAFSSLMLGVGRTKVLAAIRAAMNINGGNAVSLTWHQLQYHIIHSDNSGAGGIILPGGSIKSDAECKVAEAYKWCRLIDGCVTGNIITVESLQDLLAIVHDNNLASINLIELTQINNAPLWLRADGNGTAFASVTDLIDKMKLIVQNAGENYITLTWQQVQYALLNGNAIPTAETANAESNAKYFWRNGLTKVTDWASFLKAAQGASVGNSAALNLLTLSEINGAPVYLRNDINGAEFAADTLDAFKNKAKTLVSLAGENWAGITWEQAQYYFIHEDPALPSQGDAQTESDLLYWWAGGGQVPTDLPTLLKAAQLANAGKPAALNGLTAISDLTDDAKYLKKNFKGQDFADLAAFKTAVKAAVGMGGASMNWAQTQYTIVHGAAAANAGVANAEANAYYWWLGGGVGTPVVLSTSDITTLLEAAYRSGENGNIHAWDNLTEDLLGDWDSGFRIVKSSNSSLDFDTMTKYTMSAKADFCATLEILAAKAGTAYKTLTWYQIQDYIIVADGNYRPDGGITKDDYWWKLSKTNSGTPLTPREKFDKLLYDAVNLSAADVKDAVTWDLLDAFGFMQANGNPYDASTNISAAKTRISTLATKFPTYLVPATDGKQTLDLTWYQVEWYILKNAVKDPADAEALFKAAYSWAPPAGWDTTRSAFMMDKPLSPTTSIETIISPDGLTTTTTETATGQDVETGAITITTTVTVVTVSATATETETITTTVTTKTVTVTVIAITGEPPVTTTTSETATKVERAPIAPEVPVDPDAPTDPETPAVPEVPADPDAPTDPEIPTVPEVPVDPDAPTDPETPAVPEVPVDPDAPTDPETPSVPETPTDPVAPPEPEIPAAPEPPATPDTGTPTEPLPAAAAAVKTAQPRMTPLEKGGGAAETRVEGASTAAASLALSGAPPILMRMKSLSMADLSILFSGRGGLLPAFPKWGTLLSLTPWLHSTKAFPTPTLLAYLGGRTI